MLKRKLDGIGECPAPSSERINSVIATAANPFPEAKTEHTSATDAPLHSLVTRYEKEGYVVVPLALSSEVLEGLRQECETLMDKGHDLIEAGCVLEPVGTVAGSHPARTSASVYGSLRPLVMKDLVLGPHKLHPVILALLLGSVEAQKSASTSDETPIVSSAPPHHSPSCIYLFNEHYIVKPPHSESRFCWHTDAAEQLMMCYLDQRRTPYISVWCPLDNMTEANGSLEVWPGSHLRDTLEPPDTTVGVLLTPAPGSVVLFSSTLWHRSGRNVSEANRRAYYIQFSLNPIAVKDGPISRAIPIRVT